MAAVADRNGETASSGGTIDVSRQDAAWGAAAETLVVRAVSAALQRILGSEKAASAEVSIVLADDAFTRDLNKRYRRKDRPTNVLSFPHPAMTGGVPAPVLGDIVLARETILREAGEQHKSIEAHVSHLSVHGTLHLLGFDHETSTDAEEMEALERDILASLGFADPYQPVSEREEG